MPYSRRTGKRYAKGSSATFDGYEDVKVCASCGEKLVMSRQSLQFETNAAGRFGWHTDCPRPEATLHPVGALSS